MKNNLNTPKKWNQEDKLKWLKEQKIRRSYFEDVVSKLDSYKDYFEIIQYGQLSFDKEKYPLFALKSKGFKKDKKNVLITGGVHGYETSGVHGVLEFLKNEASSYTDAFNLILVPCVSPWAYESINRWNPNAQDPNRSFYEQSGCEESSFLMEFLKSTGTDFLLHVDLHETTDSDNTTFRPALALRDAKIVPEWEIPDGFYLVGDTQNPQFDFQKAIIDKVKKVTHIAPSDINNKIIGEDIAQEGVINYETKKLGLCAGITNAKYCTTTEVYPDSQNVTDKECIDAQVVVIKAALSHIQ